MKKPKLTKGEWELHTPNKTTDIKGICTIHNTTSGWVDVYSEEKEFNEKTHERNAQAISAVPEMIDALIGAYNELYKLMKEAHWTKEIENEELMTEIIIALKKAGCK